MGWKDAPLIADDEAKPVPKWALAPEIGEMPEAPKPMSAGDVATSALNNLLPSAGKFAGDVWSVVRHPIQTGKNLGHLVTGGIEKVTGFIPKDERYANDAARVDAVGEYFADRYGGWENLKKTMAEDPVGFLSDASIVLTGGAGAAAKVPTLAKVAKVASTAGRVLDPVNAVAKAVSSVPKAISAATTEGLGLLTGTGGAPIREALKAGREGGAGGKAFAENMRGQAPMEDVVSDAKAALQKIRQQRQDAYRAGMGEVGKDTAVLDFSKIENEMAPVRRIGTMTGKNSGVTVNINPKSGTVTDDIDAVLNEWKNLPPEDFHTAEGFDALKQRIGDIVDVQQPGSQAEKIATEAYNIVRRQIAKQSPEYAATMKGYEEMSKQIREIEKTLSLNRNAQVDTQLRKLQSVMRDNVNTSYGQRTNLVQLLDQVGAKNLMQKLAGQTLSQWAPRGLARATSPLASATLGVGSVANPAMLLPLAAQVVGSSPRAMGELAYILGQATRPAETIGETLSHLPVRQIGRVAAAVRPRSNENAIQKRIPRR